MELRHPILGHWTFTLPAKVTEFTYQIPVGNTLAGRVVGPAGKAVASAKVYAWAPKDASNPLGFPVSALRHPPRLNDWTPATTNENGDFVLERLTDSELGMLLIDAPGMELHFLKDVKFPGQGSPLEIRLQTGLNIAGSFLGKNGQPRNNVKVYLTEPELDGVSGQYDTIRKMLGQNPVMPLKQGEFSFHGLAPGEYELVVKEWDTKIVLATAKIIAGNEDVVIRQGDGLEGLMNFTFTVIHSITKQPIPQYSFRIVTENDNVSAGREEELPLNGDFHLRSNGHPVQKMALVFHLEGFQSWVKVMPAKAGDYHFDVELEPATQTKLMLQDSSGNPVVGIPVRVFHSQGRRFAGGNGLSTARYLAFPGPESTWHMSQFTGEVNIHSVPNQGGYIQLPDPKPVYPEPLVITVPDELLPPWKVMDRGD